MRTKEWRVCEEGGGCYGYWVRIERIFLFLIPFFNLNRFGWGLSVSVL